VGGSRRVRAEFFGALYLFKWDFESIKGCVNRRQHVFRYVSAQEEVVGLRMKMRIIPAIARLGVLTWRDQASAQDTSSSTVSRNPDVVLSADNVGRVRADASKLLREDSARISNPHNVAYNVTFKRSALVTTFASLASAARSRTGRGRGKLAPVSFLAPAGNVRFA
jgi:hypothetical protein